MYTLQVSEVSGFPKLAWTAQVHRNSVVVRHGPWVERGADFVVEGVWGADFDRGLFESTETIFGTGVVARGDHLTFVSSAATTDPIYYQARDDKLHVANSLPLLLLSIGAELVPACRDYHLINESVVDGIDAYRSGIPTTAGNVVRLIHRNLRYEGGAAREVEKNLPPPFPEYAVYKRYLAQQLAGILANARSGGRRFPMNVFSTQSSGFDSTAVNALCAPVGLDKVFVNRHAKGPGAFADRDAATEVIDDGGPICDALGIRPTYVERRAFETNLDEEDVYLSGLSENAEFNLHQVLSYIDRPTALFTGQYGEVWRPAEIDKPGQLDASLKRHDLGGQGWSELRLEVGFAHVAVPYLGARRRAEISKISSSPEMTPWRSGMEYDKPIPARIAVESGIGRHLFGQTKKAASAQFCPPCVPRDPALRSRYFEFLVMSGLIKKWAVPLFPIVHRINAAIWFATPYRYRVIYYFERAVSRIVGRDVHLPLLWEGLRGSPYCFAVNQRIREIASRCGGEEVASGEKSRRFDPVSQLPA